jgi:superfamily I DNA/RNA helicase
VIKFNAYQQAVVSFRHGYAVVMAAPGSGKTAVIVGRIKQLLAEGARPDEILSLTFTKEGAKEMAARAGLKDADHKRDGIKHELFSTFHSWALRFIKAEANALPFKVHRDWHDQPAPLCLPLEAAKTLAQICRRIPEIEWKDAGSYISRMKRYGLTPHEAYQNAENELEEGYCVAYEKYDEALRARGLMDFDSIIIETARLLEKRADVRARWQYRFVQVDEAQDTDSVQWRIIKAVTEKHNTALAVGDENQGMYSWRGSESNLTQYFTGIFPTAKVMPLPVNYRSTGAIVGYCKEIAPIQNETVTNLSTPNEAGTAPDFRLYVREDEEAKAVINSCTDLSNTAILARTNRQLAAFEDECGQRNLRYKLLGKSGFWSQHEVKDTVAILGSVAMPSDNNVLRMLTARCDATKYLRKNDTRDADSTITLLKKFQERNPDGATGEKILLHRLMPRFYSGDHSQDEIIQHIGRMIHELRAQCQALPGKAAMQRVVESFGLLSFYDVSTDEDEEDKKNFDNDPRENILKLIEYADRYGTLEKVYDYTQRARRATLARTNCLILSTIHQSKGKEWGTVFVVGVNEGVLPHKKGEPEEEKRIYFVACSRAAKRLQVSASGIPSELIKDKLPKAEDNKPAPVELDPWAGFQLQPS